jgi:molybdopterin-guanine dinucleotide biosynthesis protein A
LSSYLLTQCLTHLETPRDSPNRRRPWLWVALAIACAAAPALEQPHDDDWVVCGGDGVTGRAQLAAIFAGGEGRRMGGLDKASLVVGGRPLWRIVVERLAPQAEMLAVLSPTAPSWVGQAGSLWIADASRARGPAAGLLGALEALEKEQGADALLLTAPVDGPFLPEDLFEKLENTRRRAGARASIVRHAGGLHPVFGVWQAGCAGAVEEALQEERALQRIAALIGAVECDAWGRQSPDPFANLNSPEDVAAAETFLRRL